MLLTNIRRIIRTGFLNFWRNGFVSLASVLILTITLFVIGSLVFFSAIMNASLSQLKDKVDINVYFVTEALEDNIFALQSSLEALPEVKEVSYTSREVALAEFRERHKNDFLTIQALEELDENPLGASLNISAQETSQYESIAHFLDNYSEGREGEVQIVDKINYYQNKVAIDRLAAVIEGSERLGIAIVLVLAVISILITFNTIRLAIYSSREEINVMRLVGADDKYVRGPFIVEGFLYGLVSAIIVSLVFYPLTLWLGGATEQFFGGLNIGKYYQEHFGQVFSILVLSGIVLGVASSFFAVRRYLTKKYLNNS
ncbi:MAG: permease-like cell division protein FtsX [Candidatus Paceibacterota bacterium]